MAIHYTYETDRVRTQHLERTYEIKGWNDATDFLALLGRKGGRLLKGGEIDEAGGTYLDGNEF
jgi:nuclear GTP-binding protein